MNIFRNMDARVDESEEEYANTPGALLRLIKHIKIHNRTLTGSMRDNIEVKYSDDNGNIRTFTIFHNIQLGNNNGNGNDNNFIIRGDVDIATETGVTREHLLYIIEKFFKDHQLVNFKAQFVRKYESSRPSSPQSDSSRPSSPLRSFFEGDKTLKINFFGKKKGKKGKKNKKSILSQLKSDLKRVAYS
jgi:hypothetical protein